MVALLFSLESFCERHHRDRATVVGTDETCVWDKPRRESAPVLLQNLQLGKKKPSNNKMPCPNFSLSVTHIRSRLGGVLAGKAAVSPFLVPGTPSCTTKIPTVKDIAVKYKECKPSDSFERYLKEELKDNIRNVESLTSGQAESEEWFEQRKGRITSSLAHKVAHCTAVDCDNYVTAQIMQPANIQSIYTNYGISNEAVAKQLYKDSYTKQHTQASFKESGLILDSDYPFLGASPDLIVHCKCCSEGLAEIKCPYTFRSAHPEEVPLADKRHFETVGGKPTLAVKSPWYAQVQMQMAIKGCSFCDLVVYTEIAPFICVMRVPFDQQFYFSLQHKLLNFYRKFVLPKILNEA